MQENIVLLPQGIRVFHQGAWGILNISAWIHLWGWLTGSGTSGLNLDQSTDDQTLGLAPLVGMALWGPPSQSGHGVSIDPVVVGVRVVYCLEASCPDRKRVTPVGNVGSPPSSTSLLNCTCPLGLSSAMVGALPSHILLLDSLVLSCSFKSHIWRHSHSLGGPDLGGLGDDNEDCLWHSGEQHWYHLDLLLPLIGNVAFAIQIIQSESLLLAIWQPPLFMILWRVSKFTKLSGSRSVFYFCFYLEHPVGQA